MIRLYGLQWDLRVGNVLSSYFEAVARAAQSRSVAVLLSRTRLPEPVFIERLPRIVWRRDPPAHTTGPWPTGDRAHAHSSPGAALYGDLAHARDTILDCFAEVRVPSSVTCTIHLRLGDLLTVGHDLYPLVHFEWYMRHIHPATERIRIVATQELPEERLVTTGLKRWLGDRLSVPIEIQNGTIDEDFRALMETHQLLGSVSTFSWWAGVAALGRVTLPRAPLFADGRYSVVRHEPELKFVEAPLLPSSEAARMAAEALVARLSDPPGAAPSRGS